ncbi:MAG: electron transport complex subunit RsxC [Wenzhouxiangella sp.]
MTVSPKLVKHGQFHGGLALEPNKAGALQTPIRHATLPERLYLPIDQHQGDAGAVLVSPGDRVLKGQALTRAGGDRRVPCHAPSSGIIEGRVQQAGGLMQRSGQDCLVIRLDGLDEAVAPLPLAHWDTLPADALIDHLHAMGLVGMGGAMFPTAAKLRGDWPVIDCLIINAAECEPWIACDEALIRSRPEAVLAGSRILARASGARRIVLAIESHAVEALEQLAAVNQFNDQLPVELVTVPSIYPQGGERQLIQTLTGMEVPHDGLPQDLGLLCHNVATAAAAHDAVVEGRPLTERIVTLSGPGFEQPCNVLARIGTPLQDLLALAGGLKPDAARLVLGGPMSGLTLDDTAMPLGKGTNCLLALTDLEIAPTAPTLPCINCAACVEVCPASLMPQLLFRQLQADRHEPARELGLFDCIECGLCAQVCPSHLPLVDWYRHGKSVLRKKTLDQRQAALARRRFEAREARLAEQAAAREARRLKRQERLQNPDAAKDDILAAIARARGKGQEQKDD